MASKSVIFGMLLGMLTMGAGWSDLPVAKTPCRVEISATRTRFTKVAGGDWDDRLQKVQLEIHAKNLDYNHPAEGLKLHYWVFAESLVDRKDWLVIDSGSVDVNLTDKPEGRELVHKGELVTLKWDDTDAVFGQRYKAWLLVLTNAKQEVEAVKSNVPSAQTAFQRALALHNGSWCDTGLQPTKGPPN